MKIEQLYNAFLESTGVNTDTRKLKPGQMYFALVGGNFNGNDFALHALEEGCSFVVISELRDDLPKSDRVILVDNTLETLQELASYHRSKLKIPVIGLTGSNGKTTSKELLKAALSVKYNCYATQGNLNNHIGVPLSLLEIDQKHEIAIIEMGANHQKEIEFLSSICRPDSGFITNIGLSHLEGFGGEEGIYIGKKELFDFLIESKGDLFVNADDQKVVRASQGSKSITYGSNKTALFQGSYKMKGDLLEVTWWRDNNPSEKHHIRTQLSGSYNFHNVMSAVAVARFYGLTPQEIKHGVESFKPSNNRSQIKNTDQGNKVIIDCYNANPSSMSASLENLSLISNKNAVAILGDMLEVGERTEEEHLKIIDLITNLDIANAFLVGPNFKRATELKKAGFKQFDTTNDLKQYLEKNELVKSTILLKGSRKMKLEQILELL